MQKSVTLADARKTTASDKFIFVLTLISIAGFLSIVSETLFGFNLDIYIEFIWFLIIGIGFLIEGQINKLKNIKTEGLTPTNFARITTVIIGFLAILAGIFSLPAIQITNPGFLALKGIIAIVSIIIIIIQTWVVKS